MSKTSSKILIVFSMLIIVLFCLWAADRLTPSLARRALPASATSVQEYYSDSGFNGDYLRCLRARMPESEMPEFATKLGLTQRYDPKRDAKLPIRFAVDPGVSWWHQPASMEGAYFEYTPGSESFSMAMYQDGYVYYMATAW